MSGLRQQRMMGVPPDVPAEIGRWLWCLADARNRTLQRVEGLDPKLVDWEASVGGNSIGTILYHIAAVEADYLYADLLSQPFPGEIADLFPHEVREENGRLTPIRGRQVEWYLHRLEVSRGRLLESFRTMDLGDFRRLRHLTDRPVDITPEWTLYHLTQHEAEHRGELVTMRARAEALQTPEPGQTR
jgi:uncharacterized damage-inducible protein DinB